MFKNLKIGKKLALAFGVSVVLVAIVGLTGFWGLSQTVQTTGAILHHDAKLMEEALTLARRLAEGPTRALVATRALVEESEHASYEAQFRREIELQAVVRKGADAIEGRNAFVEKRKARFTGK